MTAAGGAKRKLPRIVRIVRARPRLFLCAALALVTAEGRKVPQTDEERAQALLTMISYAGRNRVEDGKVIT